MSRPLPRSASERGTTGEGISWELWLPDERPPWPALVVVHGAGSRKENHSDFARVAVGSGWAALAYDQRGHGDSAGAMSPQSLRDPGRMARMLAARPDIDAGRVCIRGSSLGGFVSIHAAAVEPSIAGAIAVCPADEELLLRGIRDGRFEMEADVDTLVPWLEEHDLREAVALMGAKPLALLHAQGDEQVPAEISTELYERARDPRKLILVPGGHHRSVQHDPELSAAALRWMERALRGSG